MVLPRLEVKSFIETAFPGIDFIVEKLDSKGPNSSFKLGVDYEH